VAGHRCKRRTCPGYAPLYLRDQAERLKAGLAEWDGETTIATVTAPGADVSRGILGAAGWTVHRSTRARTGAKSISGWRLSGTRRRHSGSLGSSMPHKSGSGRARLARPEVLATVPELKRGVFHAHIVLGYHGFSRQGLEVFLDALDQLRGEYGFGTSRQGASTGRPTEQVRPVYINPKLTAKSGVTMRFLRWARYAYVRWGRVDMPRAEELAIFRLAAMFDAELLGEGEWANGPPARGSTDAADGRSSAVGRLAAPGPGH
jgi:hypothetical protein